MLRGGLLAVLACAALALDATVVDAAAWRVPLERHVASPHGQSRRLGANAKRSSVWEPAFPQPPLPVVFPKINVIQHVVTVSVGTPPQQVLLAVDVMSGDTHVLNHRLADHAFYNHTASSTYQRNGSYVRLMADTPYEVEGFTSRDVVTIGGNHPMRLAVRNHLFVELASPDRTLQTFYIDTDGELGLGPRRSNSTGGPSLVRAMIDQRLLDSPVVGLSYTAQDAHALFGGVDPAYDNRTFHYYGDQHDGAWYAPVRGVAVAGTPGSAVTNPGFVWDWPVMAGPLEAVKALEDAIGVKERMLPCDGPGPDIVFELDGGLKVTITKHEYAVALDANANNNMCMFGIHGLDQAPFWYLGIPFLQSVYTVLDFGDAEGKERIGFAPIHRNRRHQHAPL